MKKMNIVTRAPDSTNIPYDNKILIKLNSRSTNTHSVVEYVPRTEMDYGSLLCWATNSVGRQKDPW
jgi:hypothetical protein